MAYTKINTEPASTTFLISDMTDVQITVSKITNPLFIIEASPIDRSLIGTMVSELGTNIIKYAGRGKIRISRLMTDKTVDIQIWAEDRGPGIANITRAMKEHFSTGNSLGLGLPGVRRMADDFKIDSTNETGTVIYARKRIKGREFDHSGLMSVKQSMLQASASLSEPWDVGAFTQPASGYQVSGDTVAIHQFGTFLLLGVVDVSGHGLKAHQLANAISSHINNFFDPDLELLMSGLHKMLIGTLGAAAGFLLVDFQSETFKYLGVGNTAAARCVGEGWKGVSRDGVLGQRLPGFYQQDGLLTNGDVFCLMSDGISSLAGSRFAKENAYQPAVKIAHDLVLTLGKPHDDASCLIFKWLG